MVFKKFQAAKFYLRHVSLLSLSDGRFSSIFVIGFKYLYIAFEQHPHMLLIFEYLVDGRVDLECLAA